jgi:hypothetical protein
MNEKEKILLISIASKNCMAFLKENIILTGKLNREKEIVWVVGVNERNQKTYDETFGSKRKFANVSIERFIIKEEPNYLYKMLPSYEHARGLDLVINQWKEINKYQFAFVLDPDFYMVRDNWIEEIQKCHKESYSNYVAIGTSWDPTNWKDAINVPAPHFLSIKLPIGKTRSFEPKLKKRKLSAKTNFNSSYKLNKFLNQNVETGRQFSKDGVKGYILKGILIKRLFQINKLSDAGDWQKNELSDIYLRYRRNSGIIFEHVWNQKMFNSLRDLMLLQVNEHLPNIALRKLSYIYSFKTSKAVWVREAYKSNHQYLLFNRRLYAFHLRKNLNKVNVTQLKRELNDLLNLINRAKKG